MFVAAVAGVDYRDGGVVRRHPRGAFQRVANDDGIDITADDPDCILERFPLCGRGGLDGVFGGKHLATKAMHGRLEREPGAGAGFVEEGRQQAAVSPLQIGLTEFESERPVEEFFDQVARELDWGGEVSKGGGGASGRSQRFAHSRLLSVSLDRVKGRESG